ncbi:hypothetical protein ColLi_12363 [Colletotrichum liriopes]|uniref:C3H1-type domain-containing protein n=1 Tax=Colletotrichum liriopes TaxID=708192 RepID=A0AA37GY96_9PEZI|nr:hypothetical protein ColLi_12363 [Colletotrichum liriopes]
MDGSNNLSQYAQQFEIFRHQDQARERMIGELLTRYEHLQRAYQEKCDDYSNEVESRRWWQTKAQTRDGEMQALRKTMRSNSFILVVIDGDGAVFQDSLLKAGRDGGSEAGHLLYNEIMNYVNKAYLQQPSQDWSVVVQVMLNLDGLAKRLHASGIIPNTAAERTLADFGHGFSRAQPLFNFVDVGHGKEAADHKIRETLRLMIRNNQCKHIFFGPCHDNGYLPVLEPYNVDPKINSRLTLIETTAAEEGFKNLTFGRITFHSIFRSEKLPERMRRSDSGIPHSSPRANGAGSNGDGGLPVRTSPKGGQSPRFASPQFSDRGAATTSSWSTVSTGKTIDISSKKTSPKKYYLLNVNSQRVDEQLLRVDPTVEEQFKERAQKSGKNLCNNYHLHGDCRAGDTCVFLHGAKLSPGELTLLRKKVGTGDPHTLRSC